MVRVMSFNLGTLLKFVLVFSINEKSVGLGSEKKFFQDDIQIPDGAPPDYLPIGDVTTPHHRTRRHARRMKQYLWHAKIIPYEIDTSLGKGSKKIAFAIQEFERYTCLRFRKKTYWDANWIRFQLGRMCSSSVGLVYWKPGAQNITLGDECLHKQIILHEIMHALGFWHEHSRPDRYKYIEVMWENIRKGAEENFARYNNIHSDTLGVEYDYKSILHYHNYAYSANKAPTIRVIRSLNTNVGASKGLSKGDILKINRLYDCKTHEVLRRRRRSYLSNWSEWSPCDLTCSKYRQRVCFGRRRSFCNYFSQYGVQTQKTVCPQEECYAPVDGHWGRWSQWSQCHRNNVFRTRKCSDPTPRYGGKVCPGDATQNKPCGGFSHSDLLGCNTALGLENGYFRDKNFVATAAESKQTAAAFARLNNESAWCVPRKDPYKDGHFLQLRMQSKTKVTALAMQGHPDYQSLVTKFRLYYKYGNEWKLYRHHGQKTLSQKDVDPTKRQQLIILKAFTSDSIAINPRSWLGASPCLRLEVFGCQATGKT